MNLWQLFWVFFQIGLFSIGGGYAIIPMIQDEVVNHYQWISNQTFTDIITISQMTPGPLAVNTSTFVGIQIAGMSGAFIATIGCVCSGVVISISLYHFFQKFKQSRYVFEILRGLKAASVGCILSASATILLLAFTQTSDFRAITNVDFIAIMLFMAAFICLRKFKTHPILLMIICGLIGLIVYQ